MAVGRDRFRTDAAHVMAFLQQLAASEMDPDDPTHGYMLQVRAAPSFTAVACHRTEALTAAGAIMLQYCETPRQASGRSLAALALPGQETFQSPTLVDLLDV